MFAFVTNHEPKNRYPAQSKKKNVIKNVANETMNLNIERNKTISDNNDMNRLITYSWHSELINLK